MATGITPSHHESRKTDAIVLAQALKVKPSALTLEQIDAGLVSAFLEHLEDKRKNAAVTRDVRLAAIKSFFRFLEHRQPAGLEQIRRVLAILFKKTDTRLCPTFCAMSCRPCSMPLIRRHLMVFVIGPYSTWRPVQDCASPS